MQSIIHRAIHEKCQAVRQSRFRITVFFQNFRGYNSVLIIWGLAVKKGAKVQIIGQGMEKYLVLQWGNHIEFKDSYQFLNSSLPTQTENSLASGRDKFLNCAKSSLRRNSSIFSSGKVSIPMTRWMNGQKWKKSSCRRVSSSLIFYPTRSSVKRTGTMHIWSGTLSHVKPSDSTTTFT